MPADTARWTDADHEASFREGWIIAECPESSETPYQLQKLDERSRFRSDEAAWKYVVKMAKAGSSLHMKALAYLMIVSPSEHANIVAWT